MKKLTLELAKNGGADVIRDSDGTELSPEITEAGYGFILLFVLSAVIIPGLWKIWINCSRLFLVTEPKTAVEHCLELELLKSFFRSSLKLMTVQKLWGTGRCMTAQLTRK